MKKIIWTYGIIAGIIVGAMLWITIPLHLNGVVTFDNGMYVGYTNMVIALSTIFFAVRSYRDNHQGGVISFGKALKIGLLISLIASAFYALSWEISYRTVAGDYMASYTEYQVGKLEEQGATEQQIAAAREEYESFGELYDNFFVRLGFTVMEILPVGLVISLLCAALLRKKESVASPETVP